MTEMPQQPVEEPDTPSEGGDQAYEWSGADTTSGTPGEDAGADARTSARTWLDQLQHMIDDIATQAAPVVRQVAVKAAELAVVAGEKAGPVAHRAADATETGGIRLAERARALAEELRRQQAGGDGGPDAGTFEEPAATPPAAEPEVADESDGA